MNLALCACVFNASDIVQRWPYALTRQAQRASEATTIVRSRSIQPHSSREGMVGHALR